MNWFIGWTSGNNILLWSPCLTKSILYCHFLFRHQRIFFRSIFGVIITFCVLQYNSCFFFCFFSLIMNPLHLAPNSNLSGFHFKRQYFLWKTSQCTCTQPSSYCYLLAYLSLAVICAVVGTLLNCFLIALSLLALAMASITGIMSIGLSKILDFSSGIVDANPVTVVAILTEIVMNVTLYILISGEFVLYICHIYIFMWSFTASCKLTKTNVGVRKNLKDYEDIGRKRKKAKCNEIGLA